MGFFKWLCGSEDDEPGQTPCRHDFEVVGKESNYVIEQQVIRDEQEAERATAGLPPGPPLPPPPQYPYSDAGVSEKKVCLKCCLVVDQIDAVRQRFIVRYRNAKERNRRAHEILNNR